MDNMNSEIFEIIIALFKMVKTEKKSCFLKKIFFLTNFCINIIE